MRALWVFVFAVASSTAHADDCLTRVAKFAEEVCGKVVQSGSSKVFNAEGKAKGEVGGVIRKFVGNAEASGEVTRKTERYENVLRENLPTELAGVRQCRIEMVKVGREEACAKPAAPSMDVDRLMGWWEYKYDGDLQGDMLLLYKDGAGKYMVENGSYPTIGYANVSISNNQLSFQDTGDPTFPHQYGTSVISLRVIDDYHMIGSSKDTRGEVTYEMKRSFGDPKLPMRRTFCPQPIPAAKCPRQ